MTAGGVLHTPIGTGLPVLALPYLALWLTPLGFESEGTATGECLFVNPAGQPVQRFPFPEGAEVLSWPAESEIVRLDHVGLSETVRVAAERFAQQEFDPGVCLPALGAMWTGPLCLTHAEGLALLRSAVVGEKPNIQAWAVYLAEEYRRVEAGRDALAAGDWTAFGRLIAESAAAYGVATDSLVRGDLAGKPTWESAEEPSLQTAVHWPGSPPISAPSGAVKRRFAKP